MATIEEKLKVFASWCLKYDEYPYSDPTEREGALERAIRNSREQTINNLGQMLDEILNSDTLDLENEIKNLKTDF